MRANAHTKVSGTNYTRLKAQNPQIQDGHPTANLNCGIEEVDAKLPSHTGWDFAC
jgi:hypothetical protein